MFVKSCLLNHVLLNHAVVLLNHELVGADDVVVGANADAVVC